MKARKKVSIDQLFNSELRKKSQKEDESQHEWMVFTILQVQSLQYHRRLRFN